MLEVLVSQRNALVHLPVGIRGFDLSLETLFVPDVTFVQPLTSKRFCVFILLLIFFNVFLFSLASFFHSHPH